MANRIIIKQTVTVTRKMYGWSKWGGARMGTVKETLDKWFCQSCASPQTKELPAYLITLDELEREFMRVCSTCKSVAKTNSYSTFDELRDAVKKLDYVDKMLIVANLPTIPRKI